MSPSREELVQLVQTFTKETDTEKLLRLSKQLLDTLDKLEAEGHESVRVS